MSSHFPSVIRSCIAYERKQSIHWRDSLARKLLIGSLSVTQFKYWFVSMLNLLLSFFIHLKVLVTFSSIIRFEYINLPIMMPVYDSPQWSRLMHQLTPLFRLLGDSTTPRQGKEDEKGFILRRSVNIWTGRPLFVVPPPYALEVLDLLNRSTDVWQISWIAVKVLVWVRDSAGGREKADGWV